MSSTQNQSGSLSPTLVHFISGGIAGCFAKSSIAPFDRIKILSQTNNSHYPFKGIFKTLVDIYNKEGFFRLWTGNGATIVRIAPYAAIQFMTYEKAKSVILGSEEGKTAAPLLHMICGAIAGTVSTFFTYPLDILRARLASQVIERRYRNTFHGMKVMVGEEGAKSLWKGMVPTLQGIVPYAGVNFATFETLKYYAPKKENGELSTPLKLACGGLAGAIGQTVSYPWDVVRRRRQTAGFAAGVPEFEYQGTWRTMVNIAKQEGISALYRGITINFWKVTPAVSISFTTYDSVKGYLSQL